MGGVDPVVQKEGSGPVRVKDTWGVNSGVCKTRRLGVSGMWESPGIYTGV